MVSTFFRNVLKEEYLSAKTVQIETFTVHVVVWVIHCLYLSIW